MASLSPGQIVCLEHHDDCLYGEVIQVIPERQIVWLRPLLLTQAAKTDVDATLLHNTADLLWPIHQFRPALDTEALPLLSALQNKLVATETEHSKQQEEDKRQQLRRFIEKVWANRL